MSAADHAARLLRSAEIGYERKYGTVPLETRIEIARAWIDLARIEAQAAEKEQPA